jgi:hypothetical protein
VVPEATLGPDAVVLWADTSIRTLMPASTIVRAKVAPIGPEPTTRTPTSSTAAFSLKEGTELMFSGWNVVIRNLRGGRRCVDRYHTEMPSKSPRGAQ